MSKIHLAIGLIIILGSLIASVILYPTLPEEVPIHWNINGEVDNYGSKALAAFLMPAMMLGLLGLFALLPKLDPARFEVLNFKRTFGFITVLVVGLLGYIHGYMLWGAFNLEISSSKWLLGGVLLFIAALGNVLGKTRRNFWIGIRTPWTIADERVWNETHRFGGRAFVGAGIFGVLSLLIGLPIWVSMGWIAVAVLAAVLFSLYRYKQLERQGEISSD